MTPAPPYDPFQEPPGPDEPAPGPYPWGWPAADEGRRRSGIFGRREPRGAEAERNGRTERKREAAEYGPSHASVREEPAARSASDLGGDEAASTFAAAAAKDPDATRGRARCGGGSCGTGAAPVSRGGATWDSGPGGGVERSVYEKDERFWVVACHLSPLLSFLVGLPLIGFVGPLAIWYGKRDELREVEIHGREALNFQLTVLLATVLLSFTCIVPILAQVANVVLCILAAVRASDGERYRYPWTWRPVSGPSSSASVA